jgi:hypothetical protein
LSTTLPVWAALLIVFGALIMAAAILAIVGIEMLKKGARPVPEQAFEEAQLASEALRDSETTRGSETLPDSEPLRESEALRDGD